MTPMKSWLKLKTLLIAIGILILLLLGGWTIKSQIEFANLSQPADAVTGVWRGEGTTKDNYKWFVEYTFKSGQYNMTTDSAFKDSGTYAIVKTFEDGSIQMSKTSEPFAKTYDIFLTTDPEGKFLVIEGMKLNRVK